MGDEANYAGTSFVAPPEKMIGKLNYGPALMNIQADRTQEGSLARVRVGRRRRARRPVAAHREGHLQGLPDDARAGGADLEAHRRDAVARLLVRRLVERACSSSACRTSRCCRATRTSALDDIVAATDRGIVIRNRGSWSIDHQRYNFQFSGQAFYEVQQRQDRRHAEGRRLSGATRRCSGTRMDMIGGKSSLLAGRRVQRRQGRAGASRTR